MLRVLKAKAAVEAIKAQRTAAEMAKIYDVHPNLIGMWKKQALTGLPDVFENGREPRASGADAGKDELYRQIGTAQSRTGVLEKKVRPVRLRRSGDGSNPNIRN